MVAPLTRCLRCSPVLWLQLLVWLSFFPASAQAVHLFAADWSYRCLNPATGHYELQLTLYADCEGGPAFFQASPADDINIVPSGSCGAPQLLSPWALADTQDVTHLTGPFCSTVRTICKDSTSGLPTETPGVYRIVWRAEYSFPTTAGCSYNLVLDQCCRNPALGNIQNPSTERFYLACKLFPEYGLDAPPLSEEPLLFGCLGDSIAYAFGGDWPAGDSITLQLETVRVGGGLPATYTVGGPQTPFANQAGLQLSTLRGGLYVQPAQVQNTALVGRLQHYENGSVVAESVREMTLTTSPCAPPPVTDLSLESWAGDFANNQFFWRRCPGESLQDSLQLSTPQLGQRYRYRYTPMQGRLVTSAPDSFSAAPVFNFAHPGAGRAYGYLTVEREACPRHTCKVYALSVAYNTGEVSIEVLDDATGQPLPDQPVEVVELNPQDTSLRVLAADTTDANGQTLLQDVPIGSPDRFLRTRPAPGSSHFAAYYQATPPGAGPRELPSYAAALNLVCNVVVQRNLRPRPLPIGSNTWGIEGKLLDEGGQPVANQRLVVYEPGTEFPLSRAFTDAAGYFQLSGLPLATDLRLRAARFFHGLPPQYPENPLLRCDNLNDCPTDTLLYRRRSDRLSYLGTTHRNLLHHTAEPLTLYPVPVEDKLTVEGPEHVLPLEFAVYTLQGHRLYQAEIRSLPWQLAPPPAWNGMLIVRMKGKGLTLPARLKVLFR